MAPKPKPTEKSGMRKVNLFNKNLKNAPLRIIKLIYSVISLLHLMNIPNYYFN